MELKNYTLSSAALSALGYLGDNRIPGALARFATANPSCGGLTVNAALLALKQITESVSGKTIIAWNSSDVPVPEGRYVRLAYTAILETLCRNYH